MKVRLLAVVAAVVLMLAAPGGVATASPVSPGGGPATSPAQSPTRILLLGDSVAHGVGGDWTWRYRLWRHLEQQRVAVDFVGPRTDLHDVNSANPSHAYLDPDFDQDHASVWGQAIAFLAVPIDRLMVEHRPDVLVVALGTNDLTFLQQNPDELVWRLELLIDQARSLRPDLDIVVVEPTQTWFPSIADYNALLPGFAERKSTPESRVEVADAASGFTPADTWDNSHANARGEVKIADAVAAALSRLGIGVPAARATTFPALGPRQAPSLSAQAADRSVVLRWSAPAGVTGYRLHQRHLGAGNRPSAWRTTTVTGLTRRLTGLANDRRYQFRLQPLRGSLVAAGDAHSSIVTATPRPARPRAVVGVSARLGGVSGRQRAVRVTWARTPGAVVYTVRWQRADGRGPTRSARTRGTQQALRLPRSVRHIVQVRAENTGGTGAWSARRVVSP